MRIRTLLHIVAKETEIPEDVLKNKCRAITQRYGSPIHLTGFY